MQNKNKGDKNKLCLNEDCEYNPGIIRPHVHIMTNDGSYVKFIYEKPKNKLRSITDADPG